MELFAEKVASRGLCAQAQAESLKYKLLGGLAVRRACYGVLRFVMEQGAKGAEVIVSGKLRAQRAKSMKFSDGYMIKSGQAKRGACVNGLLGYVLLLGWPDPPSAVHAPHTLPRNRLIQSSDPTPPLPRTLQSTWPTPCATC